MPGLRRAIENLTRVHYGRPHTEILTVPLDMAPAEGQVALRTLASLLLEAAGAGSV